MCLFDNGHETFQPIITTVQLGDAKVQPMQYVCIAQGEIVPYILCIWR